MADKGADWAVPLGGPDGPWRIDLGKLALHIRWLTEQTWLQGERIVIPDFDVVESPFAEPEHADGKTALVRLTLLMDSQAALASIPPAQFKLKEPFDIFLSYNGRDRSAVREIYRDLRQRGLRPWLDEEELVPGRPWQEGLETVIGTIRAASVLIGQGGLGPWENREVRAFLEEFVRRRVPVIPVLLPGAPEKPEIPIFLRAFTWVDMRLGINKSQLDLLVWGITGIKPGGDAIQLPVSWEAQVKRIGMHNADQEVPRLLSELTGEPKHLVSSWLLDRLKKNLRQPKHKNKQWVVQLREAARGV